MTVYGAAPGTTQAQAPAPASAEAPSAERRQGGGSALAWILAAVFFTAYCALSVRDQQRMTTSAFDLGIFDEAVRGYAHGHAPIVALKGTGFDLLGDHFSPIWAGLAPFYLLFPTVYTLLVAQAALMASAVVPIVRWAAAEAGPRAAAVLGAGYGLSWGIASAIGFDVHEVAFAVPLLAWSATALGRRRWRAAAAWALPLLLVKEDLGVTVAAIGLYIAVRGPGSRRLGAAVAAIGLLGSALEIKVLIPAADPRGIYLYGGAVPDRSGVVVQGVLQTLLPGTRLATLLLMLACTGFLALFSPITLLTVPTLAWRFLSENQTYWGTSDHYSATLMPVVFAASVDALIRLRASRRRQAHLAARAMLGCCLAVTSYVAHDYPLWHLTGSTLWSANPRSAAAHRIMALIPPDATVAADDYLAPQLTDVDTVSLLDTATPAGRPGWVLLDTADPDVFPLRPGQQAAIIGELEHEGYRPAAEREGYLLLVAPRTAPGP